MKRHACQGGSLLIRLEMVWWLIATAASTVAIRSRAQLG